MASAMPYPPESEPVPGCRMPARCPRRKPGTPVGSPAGGQPARSAPRVHAHRPASPSMRNLLMTRARGRLSKEGGSFDTASSCFFTARPGAGVAPCARPLPMRKRVPGGGPAGGTVIAHASCATSRAHPRKGKPPPCCSTCTCSSACRSHPRCASLPRRRRRHGHGAAPGGGRLPAAGRLPAGVTTRAGRPARGLAGSGVRHGPCSG